jgi:tRNA-2-methylthio-N6-dimethylallyladenosine synthase
MPDQVPKKVVQERYDRLIELVNDIAWEENRRLEGRVLEVLVSEGEGRKDERTHRLSGRAPDNRLVHVAVDDTVGIPRPGDFVVAEVTYAAPHHLVADRVVSIRRTRAGDASQAPTPGVALGMPAMPAPASG